MNFKSTVLFVKDIERSKRFYTSVLNFKIEMDSGLVVSLSHGIALWQIPDGHDIHRLQTADTQKKESRFELYFESDDLEALSKQFKEQPIRFFEELHEESWGQKTLRFFDPDGHLIEVGEPLYIFIRRMVETGMSLEQISEKTGMKAEDIQKVLVSQE